MSNLSAINYYCSRSPQINKIRRAFPERELKADRMLLSPRGKKEKSALGRNALNDAPTSRLSSSFGREFGVESRFWQSSSVFCLSDSRFVSYISGRRASSRPAGSVFSARRSAARFSNERANS